jgi:hypothetical protein
MSRGRIENGEDGGGGGVTAKSSTARARSEFCEVSVMETIFQGPSKSDHAHWQDRKNQTNNRDKEGRIISRGFWPRAAGACSGNRAERVENEIARGSCPRDLNLPGQCEGKGFHSGEFGSLLTEDDSGAVLNCQIIAFALAQGVETGDAV